MTSDDVTSYGNWEKDRVLGVGGFGIVTLWKNGDEYIALKKCRWENITFETVSPKQKERWRLEVSIMKSLNHRNVVRFVTLPEDFASLKSELPILSMEYCSLGDLRQVLNKPENCSGLRETEVRCIIMDIKNAICYLHTKKITHRDLKPENIVLHVTDDVPGGIVYKLIDLGYAKVLDQSSICNSFVGTLQYLAPELFTTSDYTQTVDYWSLGLVSHEIITGVRPFLPNMPPTQWMMHVEKKKSDEICAYQDITNGEIVFRKELFRENYISEYLKDKLEEWLQLALEYNPRKRGGPVNKQTGQPKLFELLDTIFNKKIVIVFCVTNYQRLSYEVDSATAVSTLKVWVERDANQPVSNQLLLLPNGDILGDESLAKSCWDPSLDIMLFVFPKKGFQLPNHVKPYIPDFVKFLLQNGKLPFEEWPIPSGYNMEFSLQRRMCAHCVFFLHQELLLYQNLLDAYDVKVSSLVTSNDELVEIQKDTCAALERLKATHELVLKLLDSDRKRFQETLSKSLMSEPTRKQMMDHFERIITSQYEKLSLELQHRADMEKTSQVAGREITYAKMKLQELINASPMPGLNKLNVMQTLVKAGYACFTGLIRAKKQERSSGDTSGKQMAFDPILKPVYHFLKVRDKALNDAVFDEHLRQVEGCEDKICSLEEAVKKLLQSITDSCERIVKLQLARQEELWKLCDFSRSYSSQTTPSFTVSSPEPHQFARSISTYGDSSHRLSRPLASRSMSVREPDQNLHDSVDSLNNLENSTRPTSRPISSIAESPPPVPNNNPVFNMNSGESQVTTSCLGNSLGVSMYNSQLDSTTILSENDSLRYVIMDCMAEVHRKLQTIKQESNVMDWNALLKPDDS